MWHKNLKFPQISDENYFYIFFKKQLNNAMIKLNT